MNKKLVSGVMTLLAISFVIAGYYAIGTFSGTYDNPLDVSGELVQSLDCGTSSTCLGDAIVVDFVGEEPRTITISDDADSTEGVDVTYLGSLTLTKKDTTTWEPTGETIDVVYTLVGDSFEVIGVPEGYTAIYYKDAVSQLDDRLASPQAFIPISEVSGNLPYEDDGNAVEEANYCQDPDNYLTCKGAKIWLIPSSAVLEGNEIDWSSMADFYYETSLIQYNAEGEVIVYPGQSIEVTPRIEYADTFDGDYSIDFNIA